MNRREHGHLAKWVWDVYDDAHELTVLAQHLAEFPEVLTPVRNGESIMVWAILARDRSAIDLLIERGFSFESAPDTTGTYLAMAVMAGDLELVRSIVAWKVELDHSDDGMPPLHLALQRRRLDIATVLVQAGAGLTALGDCWAPLHFAAANDDVAALELLIAAGAPLDQTELDNDRTPLMVAARTGAENAVDVLLLHGARRGVKAGCGRTACDIAAEHGHQRLARRLAPDVT